MKSPQLSFNLDFTGQNQIGKSSGFHQSSPLAVERLKGPSQPLACFCLHLWTQLTKLLQISTQKIPNRQEE